MALESLETAPAPKEEIPFLVMAAAGRVEMTEFILLRLRTPLIPEAERDQLKQLASLIRTEQMEAREGEIFNLSDEIRFSVDPLTAGARLILKNVPLAEYLAARQVALQGQLDWNFEKIKAFGGQDLIEKGKRKTQELLLNQALAEAIKTTSVPANERNLALNFFRAQVEKIKSGRIKRYDLVTFARDWEGQENLFSPAQRIIEEVKLFSDTEIKTGVQSLLNELTGEIDGWGVVDRITLDKPDKRDTSHSHHDVLTWEITTLADTVKIGVDKVVDDRGEWSRIYYLFHSRA